MGIKVDKKKYTTSRTGLLVVVISRRKLHSVLGLGLNFVRRITLIHVHVSTSTRYAAVYIGVSSCTLEICGI